MPRNIISATDDDAGHFTVFDGKGREIHNVLLVNLEDQTVTVYAFDSNSRLHLNSQDEPVQVTYMPKGGVKVIDDREASDA